MNPDGTLQTEFYGGNSSWPTSLHHARAIPGSDRVLAIASGHHTWQTGFLGLIDRSAGGESGAGLQLLAPRRGIPRQRVDVFPPSNPNPSINTRGPSTRRNAWQAWQRSAVRPPARLGCRILGFTTSNSTALASCWPRLRTPISRTRYSLPPRPKPLVIPDQVDYRNRTAVCFVQDVYMGRGTRWRRARAGRAASCRCLGVSGGRNRDHQQREIRKRSHSDLQKRILGRERGPGRGGYPRGRDR